MSSLLSLLRLIIFCSIQQGNVWEKALGGGRKLQTCNIETLKYYVGCRAVFFMNKLIEIHKRNRMNWSCNVTTSSHFSVTYLDGLFGILSLPLLTPVPPVCWVCLNFWSHTCYSLSANAESVSHLTKLSACTTASHTTGYSLGRVFEFTSSM